jgi:hypothetical protein
LISIPNASERKTPLRKKCLAARGSIQYHGPHISRHTTACMNLNHRVSNVLKRVGLDYTDQSAVSRNSQRGRGPTATFAQSGPPRRVASEVEISSVAGEYGSDSEGVASEVEFSPVAGEYVSDSPVARPRAGKIPMWSNADLERWERFINPSSNDDDDSEDWDTADESVKSDQLVREVATARSADHSVQVTPSTASAADRENLLKQVGTWLEGIDAVGEHLNGNTELDMHRLASQCFQSRHDSHLTDYVKMSAGSADILTGTHKCIEQLHGLHITTGWPRTLAGFSCGTIIGSTILIVAGINGMKHGVKDAKDIKKLVEPLTAYKSFLLDLQEELRSSGTSDVAALISRNSEGVEARLRIVKSQLTHALFEIADSAAHAGLGAIGAAEGAAALAHALPVVKVLGLVYATAIAAFGAITATRSGAHLHELKKLAKAVKSQLKEDDPLRKPLLEFIAHERKVRTREVSSRALMGAAGATSAGLQIAGIAGAAPTAGASCALLAMGAGMGCATAAALAPIPSRRHALRAVGGVEHLTHESADFLYEPEHLSHLLNKTRQEEELEASVRKEVILGAPAIEDTSTFKHSHRLHRLLSKVIPSAEWRFVANRMVSQTESFSEPSMRFMLESTKLEREYLSHKVLILDRELATLKDEWKTSGSDLLTEQLMIKTQAVRLTAMRLALLEDLELQLTKFSNQHPDSKDLGNAEVKEVWDNIQIDFIVAHGMAMDALSRKKREEVRKKLDMKEVLTDPLREALHKNINKRFARVFAHSFPKRIGYVQRGVIEIALAMFCNDEKKKQAMNERNDLPSSSTDRQGQQGRRGSAAGRLHIA